VKVRHAHMREEVEVQCHDGYYVVEDIESIQHVANGMQLQDVIRRKDI
jgi:hypothetical protein